jgi:pyridoxine kinase
MILILSSFVASSPVGGGAQALALARLEVESVLAPTVLFGRHPGLGPPGGGVVDPALFAGVLEGIEANRIFAHVRAVIAGYFAHPDQVAAAARAIDAVRAATTGALIVVDPILGDSGPGLYVKPEVARAAAAQLVPRADILAPNVWELEHLSGKPARDAISALDAARALGRPALVSSIPAGKGIGVLWAGAEEAWLATHEKAPAAPNGTGDLLTALFTAALVGGASPVEALETATADVAAQVLGRDLAVRLEAVE